MLRMCFNYLLFGLMLACATPASAQELLANRSFENPVAPALGNNFYVTIPNWSIINLVPNNPNPFNIIIPHAGYANNPSAPPPGGGNQYLDVTSASGTIRQAITVPADGMIDFGGWFSVRDYPQALAGLNVRIVTASGTTVASVSTSFVATDPIGLWKQASLSNIPVAAGTYYFEADIPNYANFDLASVVFKPPLTVSKTSTAYSDPLNGKFNAKHIPGGLIEYTIAFATPSSYSVSSNSIMVVDKTPLNTDLVVADFGLAGSGPAVFSAGNSTLTYGFSSLSSTTDNIDFSNDGSVSWNYTPVPNQDGVDRAVTHVRFRPQGAMAPSASANFRLRYRVR